MTRFHVVGIGGAGMSAIARLLLARGHAVSGSDRGAWPLAAALAREGATVHEGFDAEHLAGAEIVVRSSAYREDNPEVAAALRRGLAVWRREDAWRLLAEGQRVVAVAGTHGKTTTTALVWTALRAGGIDASLVCGGTLRDLGANAHAGTSDVLVIEADEYDRAFHALRPDVAVVTNVEHEHVDVYPAVEDVEEAFRAFVSGVVPGGALVASADDAGAARLARWMLAEVPGRATLTYGTAPEAAWRILDLTEDGGGLAFRVGLPGGGSLPARLRLPGAHNARNATAAVAAAEALGVPAIGTLPALAGFGGIERRLEVLGDAGGVTVVDDYAHHPTEIRASIAAMRARSPARLVALFQPHTPSRLAAFLDDFAAALSAADVRVVAETFASAREREDPAGGARALAERSGASYARSPEDAADALAALVQGGDLVLVLGAGDIRAAGEGLLERLRASTPA
ncbi:MAG TPA: UDP-N-acetylmuramate--L-alanine ligase [Candidatus Limnocylindrales bacterium]|nr:UDP-N-acetylmuramate--L-alanine ligase [Candidatus Limnocylindrales bacterium]